MLAAARRLACNYLRVASSGNRSVFSLSTRRGNKQKHDSYVCKLMIMFALTNGNSYLYSSIFIYMIIRWVFKCSYAIIVIYDNAGP